MKPKVDLIQWIFAAILMLFLVAAVGVARFQYDTWFVRSQCEKLIDERTGNTLTPQ